MVSFCGGYIFTPANQTIQLLPQYKECAADLASLLLNIVLCLLSSCLLLWLQFVKKASVDKDVAQYYYEHTSRWILNSCLIFSNAFSLAEGILSSQLVSLPGEHLHIIVTPVISFLSAILVLVYYHKVETKNCPKYLLILLLYWPLASFAQIAKLLVLYESGINIYYLRLKLTWANIVLYSLLGGIELTVLLQQKYFGKHGLSLTSRSIVGIKYLHNYVTILSKATFFWLLPLLKVGYQRPLEFEDLGKLPEEERAEQQYERFFSVFQAEKAKAESKGKRVSLWKCYFRCFWHTLALGGLIKIVGDLVGLIGPMSISVILAYVERVRSKEVYDEHQAVSTWYFLQNGYIMACIVLFATFLQSTFSNNFNHLAIVEGIHLRSALQGLVYRKSLRMTTASGLDMGAVVNHMSVDSINMMMLFTMGHYIWAVPFKIALLLILLYLQLGYSALIGAATIYILGPLQYRICSKLSAIQKDALDVSDERLRKTTELLQGIKLLKLYGWEIMYGKLIGNVREKELKLLKKDAIYVALNTFITQASSILVTLVTFAIYSKIEGKSLTPAEVFTGLALFNQLTVPLYIIPFVIPIVINSVVSTSRLTKFLNSPEVESNVPWRNLINEDKATVEYKPESGSVCLYIHEKEELPAHTPFIFDDADGVFLPEIPNHLPPEGPVAICVEDASFMWNLDDRVDVLRNVNLQIPNGKLTCIVGQVGSGKSSLLSAMLGELIVTRGCVKWSSATPSVAYVPQKPWLLNATFKENILFGQPYDGRRYHQIIQACALQPDIDILPAKDMTEIGERGVNLSGGQRQRIALARAFYSLSKTVILDDPLSALDAHVSNHLFEQGIKTMLLRRGRTIVMVTNNVEYLPQANKILVLENGRVKYQGSLAEIEGMDKELTASWKRKINIQDKVKKLPDELVTIRERHKLNRILSRQVLYRSGSSTDMRRPKKPRMVSLTRQMSHDPSSPLPCHDIEHNDNPWTFSISSDYSDRVASQMRGMNEPVNSIDSLHSKSSGSSGVFMRYSGRKPPSRLNSRISAHTSEMIEEENEDEEKDVQTSVVADSTAATGDEINKDKENSSLMSISATNLQTGKLVVAEDRERGQISKQVYLSYMKACSFPLASAVIVLIVVTQTVKVATDFWLSEWSNVANSTTLNESEAAELHHYMIGYALFSAAGIVLSLITNLVAQLVSLNAVRVLHASMLRNIIHCPMKFFDTTPVGRIINRFSSDISIIDKKLPVTLPVLLRFILLCVSAIIVDIIVTPYFTIAVIPIMAVYYFLQYFFRFSSRELQRLDSTTKSPIFSHFTETLNGLTTIRAFSEERRFTEKLNNFINCNNISFTMASCANCWLGISLDYLGGIILFIATLAAMTAGILGHVSPAFVGMAMTYTLLVPIYLNWVVRNVANVEMYMNAVERVENYTHLPVENYSGLDSQVLPQNWPAAGEIIFEGVTLKYDTVKDPVLKRITLTINAGEKVGICGRTGSGKSSLVLALFRLISITEGKIVVDGVNITALPLETLRSRLSIIPQDTVLFSGTIRENLDPGQLYSDEELWKALEISQLKEVVQANKEALDYEIAEEGNNFSAGQRQLFCLARAVLRKSSILVMDEATASLDGETDLILQDVVAKHWEKSTILTIAHRVSSILNYDRVIVLEAGKIAEVGKPAELLEQRGSLFASLAKSA